jgi:hypothetical protein
MRPSHLVRRYCPLRNQCFFCSGRWYDSLAVRLLGWFAEIWCGRPESRLADAPGRLVWRLMVSYGRSGVLSLFNALLLGCALDWHRWVANTTFCHDMKGIGTGSDGAWCWGVGSLACYSFRPMVRTGRPLSAALSCGAHILSDERAAGLRAVSTGGHAHQGSGGRIRIAGTPVERTGLSDLPVGGELLCSECPWRVLSW